MTAVQVCVFLELSFNRTDSSTFVFIILIIILAGCKSAESTLLQYSKNVRISGHCIISTKRHFSKGHCARGPVETWWSVLCHYSWCLRTGGEDGGEYKQKRPPPSGKCDNAGFCSKTHSYQPTYRFTHTLSHTHVQTRQTHTQKKTKKQKQVGIRNASHVARYTLWKWN